MEREREGGGRGRERESFYYANKINIYDIIITQHIHQHHVLFYNSMIIKTTIKIAGPH